MLCYDDVSTDRAPAGMGVGTVRLGAVYDWARHHGMTYQQTNRLWAVIKRVDARVRRKLNERK